MSAGADPTPAEAAAIERGLRETTAPKASSQAKAFPAVPPITEEEMREAAEKSRKEAEEEERKRVQEERPGPPNPIWRKGMRGF